MEGIPTPQYHLSKSLITNLHHPLFTLSFFLAKVFIDNYNAGINDLDQGSTITQAILFQDFEHNINNQESVYTRTRDYMLNHKIYGNWFKEIIRSHLLQEIKSNSKESIPLYCIQKDTDLKILPASEKYKKYLELFLDIINKKSTKPDNNENNQIPEQYNEIPDKTCTDKTQCCLTRCVGALISLLTQMRMKRKGSVFSRDQLSLSDQYLKPSSKGCPTISVDLLNQLISMQSMQKRSISRTDSTSSMEYQSSSRNSSLASSRRNSITIRQDQDNLLNSGDTEDNGDSSTYECILEEGDDPARGDEAMEIEDDSANEQEASMETQP